MTDRIIDFNKTFIFPFVFIALLLCSCHKSKTNQAQESDLQTEMQDSLSADSSAGKITAEMAYEGVNNYCHKEYDWSIAEDNPDIMYIQMGEETETEYQVVFRSYTGAFVYFYVDKTSGTTKIVEKAPSLGFAEDDGENQSSDGEYQSSDGEYQSSDGENQSSSETINLFDYIEKK